MAVASTPLSNIHRRSDFVENTSFSRLPCSAGRPHVAACPLSIWRTGTVALLLLAQIACGETSEGADGGSAGDTADTTKAAAGPFDPADCDSTGPLLLDRGDKGGLGSFCVVNGDLYITQEVGKAAIDDATLDQLQHIREVKGSVYITGTSAKALLGLAALETIGADLVVDDNDELQSLAGLDALTAIGHDLVIRGNLRLAQIGNFKALASVANGILLKDNQSLANLSGLDKIAKVDHSVTLEGNQKLLHVDGLGGLKHGGSNGITVVNNGQLQRLDGFTKLESAGEKLVVRDNGQLQKLGTFASLIKVDHVTIQNNDQLKRIDGFNKLSECKTLRVVSNALVEQLAGFAQLVNADEVYIQQQKSMQQLIAFANLTQAETLEISKNGNLTEMSFPKLHQLVSLTLKDNNAISNFGSLLALKYVQNLTICNNPQLSEAETDDFLKTLYKAPQKVTLECK